MVYKLRVVKLDIKDSLEILSPQNSFTIIIFNVMYYTYNLCLYYIYYAIFIL